MVLSVYIVLIQVGNNLTLRNFFSEYLENLRIFFHQWIGFFDNFYFIYKGSLSILDIPLFELLLMTLVIIYITFFLWCGYMDSLLAFKDEYSGQYYILTVTMAFLSQVFEGFIFFITFSVILTFTYPFLMILENSY